MSNIPQWPIHFIQFYTDFCTGATKIRYAQKILGHNLTLKELSTIISYLALPTCRIQPRTLLYYCNNNVICFKRTSRFAASSLHSSLPQLHRVRPSSVILGFVQVMSKVKSQNSKLRNPNSNIFWFLYVSRNKGTRYVNSYSVGTPNKKSAMTD